MIIALKRELLVFELSLTTTKGNASVEIAKTSPIDGMNGCSDMADKGMIGEESDWDKLTANRTNKSWYV
jgi:hypothetical protein